MQWQSISAVSISQGQVGHISPAHTQGTVGMALATPTFVTKEGHV